MKRLIHFKLFSILVMHRIFYDTLIHKPLPMLTVVDDIRLQTQQRFPAQTYVHSVVMVRELAWEILVVSFLFELIHGIPFLRMLPSCLGPLIAGGQVVGIVSWGIACAQGKGWIKILNFFVIHFPFYSIYQGRPDVYSRVYAFAFWINENS